MLKDMDADYSVEDRVANSSLLKVCLKRWATC